MCLKFRAKVDFVKGSIFAPPTMLPIKVDLLHTEGVPLKCKFLQILANLYRWVGSMINDFHYIFGNSFGHRLDQGHYYSDVLVPTNMIFIKKYVKGIKINYL